MAKMTPEKLAALQQHDKPAFDFNNPEISAFFERALPQGYTLETNGFAAHPGFFQAPHRRNIDDNAVSQQALGIDLTRSNIGNGCL